MQVTHLSRSRGAWGLIIKELLGDYCAHCGRGDVELAIDHRIPLVKGGPHAFTNLQLLCASCHMRKTVNDVQVRNLMVSKEFLEFVRLLLVKKSQPGSPLLREYSSDWAYVSEVAKFLGVHGRTAIKHVKKMVWFRAAELSVTPGYSRKRQFIVVFDIARLEEMLREADGQSGVVKKIALEVLPVRNHGKLPE